MKLGGEEFEVNTCFSNVKRFETLYGGPMQMLQSIASSRITLTEIVGFYHVMQTAKLTEEQIYEKVRQDGMSVHVLQLGQCMKDMLGLDEKKLKAQQKELAK